MTNERAVEILNLDLDILGQYGDKTAEAYKMAIKALEQEPCEDCISRQAVIILIDEASEMHPYKVVGDSDTYSNYNQGWSDACDWLYANIEGVPSVIPQIQPNSNEFFNFDAPMVKKSDAVSREAVIRLVEQYPNIIGNRCSGLIADIKHLPPVTPKYTDEEIDKIQEIEQAYVDNMVELAVEEIKERYSDAIGKMKKAIDEMTEIHSDGEFYIKNVDAKWIISKYLCGAEMSGGEEDEVSD